MNKLTTFQKILNVVEKFTKWFFMVSPALYVILNYFFIITEKQRTTPLGITFLIISIIYFIFCCIFFWKNKDIYLGY